MGKPPKVQKNCLFVFDKLLCGKSQYLVQCDNMHFQEKKEKRERERFRHKDFISQTCRKTTTELQLDIETGPN